MTKKRLQLRIIVSIVMLGAFAIAAAAIFRAVSWPRALVDESVATQRWDLEDLNKHFRAWGIEYGSFLIGSFNGNPAELIMVRNRQMYDTDEIYQLMKKGQPLRDAVVIRKRSSMEVAAAEAEKHGKQGWAWGGFEFQGDERFIQDLRGTLGR